MKNGNQGIQRLQRIGDSSTIYGSRLDCVYREHASVGTIIRVVGDGFSIIFVQDILVFPSKQRKGVGTALLKAVLDRYHDVRQIELTTDNTPKTLAFYKSLGFSEFSEIGCCGFMRC